MWWFFPDKPQPTRSIKDYRVAVKDENKFNNGKEIDLMILENGRLYPVEIRKSAGPGKNALKNFRILESLPEETGEGAVICMTPLVMPLDEKNRLVPVMCI